MHVHEVSLLFFVMSFKEVLSNGKHFVAAILLVLVTNLISSTSQFICPHNLYFRKLHRLFFNV